MPGRITELSESQIIADLLRDRRRIGAAVTSVQMPQPAKDTFTVAATPATTYTLTAIPYVGTGGSSLNFSLNGVELVEGVDYTVDYTTAIVTVSATLKGTPTPADVLTADYWTTGDLIALTVAPDTGVGPTTTLNTPGTSITVAAPVGLAVGDMMVLAVATNNGGTASAPAGWTSQIDQTGSDNASHITELQAWTKVATSGDINAFFTVTWPTSVTAVAAVVKYTGPAAVEAGRTSFLNGTAATTTWTSAFVTTLGANRRVVTIWGRMSTTTGEAITGDAALTTNAEVHNTATDSLIIQSEVQAVAAASTTRTATAPHASSWVAFTLDLA